MTDSDKLLKSFLEEQFDFYELRKIGFFKGLKKSDIHEQAERICKFFGYKTVYEHGAQGIRAHFSYADGYRPLHVNKDGELKEEPFVTVVKGIYDN